MLGQKVIRAFVTGTSGPAQYLPQASADDSSSKGGEGRAPLTGFPGNKQAHLTLIPLGLTTPPPLPLGSKGRHHVRSTVRCTWWGVAPGLGFSV